MGFLSGKNKTTIVDGVVGIAKRVVGMVDEKNFTAEEASKFNLDIAQGAAKFVSDSLNESTERSVTRRKIAVEFMRFFCLLVLILIGAWLYNPEWGQFILDLMIKLKLSWAFMAIIGFFFGTHLLRLYTPETRKSKGKRS